MIKKAYTRVCTFWWKSRSVNCILICYTIVNLGTLKLRVKLLTLFCIHSLIQLVLRSSILECRGSFGSKVHDVQINFILNWFYGEIYLLRLNSYDSIKSLLFIDKTIIRYNNYMTSKLNDSARSVSLNTKGMFCTLNICTLILEKHFSFLGYKKKWWLK